MLQPLLFGQGYICAVGGGSEDYQDWSDDPYRWIVQKADYGKIIIISDAGATSWLPQYFMSFGADTAYNKTIASVTVANLQSTYDELITAKAIFIRGGDQWEYIRLWKGTKVDSAINYIFSHGGVVAGTSAGMAVLGAVDFSAKNGSAYPDETLLNPFDITMQFEDSFLNFVPGVLFDTHLSERGRQGRLLCMLLNRFVSTGQKLTGVGIDDLTALCIEPNGEGEVMGSGAVQFYTFDAKTRMDYKTNGDFKIEQLKCDQLTRHWKFSLPDHAISFVPASAQAVEPLRQSYPPQTTYWLTGSNTVTDHLAMGLEHFLETVNTGHTTIITHPGYASQIASVTAYLTTRGISADVLYITDSELNSPSFRDKLSLATNLIFAGDSLSVLVKLRNAATLAGSAFLTKTINEKIPVFFFGKTGKLAGSYYSDNLSTDIYAAYRGRMTFNTGFGIHDDMLTEPAVFEDSDYYENRICSVPWAMMRGRRRLGIYMNGNAALQINAGQKTISQYGKYPSIFIDASATTLIDSSTYRASSSVGPRQIVMMNNLRYSLAKQDSIVYDIHSGTYLPDPAAVVKEKQLQRSVKMWNNYPNPFNSSTVVKFETATGSVFSVSVYTILGQLIYEIPGKYYSSGTHEINLGNELFSVRNLPGGVYLCTLRAGNLMFTNKMVYLK